MNDFTDKAFIVVDLKWDSFQDVDSLKPLKKFFFCLKDDFVIPSNEVLKAIELLKCQIALDW
jgi:hypothetical protein